MGEWWPRLRCSLRTSFNRCLVHAHQFINDFDSVECYFWRAQRKLFTFRWIVFRVWNTKTCHFARCRSRPGRWLHIVIGSLFACNDPLVLWDSILGVFCVRRWPVPCLCYTIKMFSELFELFWFRSLSFPRAVILTSASAFSYLLHGCQIRCRYIWASTRHNVTELRSALNNKTRTNAEKTFSMHLLVSNFLFFPLLILFFFFDERPFNPVFSSRRWTRFSVVHIFNLLGSAQILLYFRCSGCWC